MARDPRTGQTIIDPLAARFLTSAARAIDRPNYAPGGFLGPMALTAAAMFRENRAKKDQKAEMDALLGGIRDADFGDPEAVRGLAASFLGSSNPLIQQLGVSFLGKSLEKPERVLKEVGDDLWDVTDIENPQRIIDTPEKLSAKERLINEALDPNTDPKRAAFITSLLEGQGKTEVNITNAMPGPVSPEEKKDLGFREGSVVVRNSKGELKVLQAGTTLTVEEKRGIRMQRNMRNAIVNIQTALDSGKVDLGILAGKWRSIKKAAGGVGVPSLSKEEAAFMTNVANLRKMGIAVLRGAQVGPLEEKSFNDNYPVQDDSAAMFKAKLGATIQQLNTAADLTWQALDPTKWGMMAREGRIPDRATQQTMQPSPAELVPGAIFDGYRYKGGNPKDPNNWELPQ